MCHPRGRSYLPDTVDDFAALKQDPPQGQDSEESNFDDVAKVKDWKDVVGNERTKTGERWPLGV